MDLCPLRQVTTYTHWARFIPLWYPESPISNPLDWSRAMLREQINCWRSLEAGMLGYRQVQDVSLGWRISPCRNSQVTNQPLRAQYIITALRKHPRFEYPSSIPRALKQSTARKNPKAISKFRAHHTQSKGYIESATQPPPTSISTLRYFWVQSNIYITWQFSTFCCRLGNTKNETRICCIIICDRGAMPHRFTQKQTTQRIIGSRLWIAM